MLLAKNVFSRTGAVLNVPNMHILQSRPLFALDPIELDGLVNPQIADCLNMNWNKVIN